MMSILFHLTPQKRLERSTVEASWHKHCQYRQINLQLVLFKASSSLLANLRRKLYILLVMICLSKHNGSLMFKSLWNTVITPIFITYNFLLYEIVLTIVIIIIEIANIILLLFERFWYRGFVTSEKDLNYPPSNYDPELLTKFFTRYFKFH